MSSRLKKLDLSYCIHLTDSSVRAVASNLPGLQVLLLGSCKLITDCGLLGIEEPSHYKPPVKWTVRKQLDIDRKHVSGMSFISFLNRCFLIQLCMLLFYKHTDLEVFVKMHLKIV